MKALSILSKVLINKIKLSLNTGFSAPITDFSIDNEMIVVASKDKSFRIFNLKELDFQMQ